MTKLLKVLAALIFALPLFAQAKDSYSQAELDQMLAPVALYPDPLLSQVLMAATYPRDVVEAADWSRAHANLQGDDAVRAVADEEWDPSVKSLCAFPQVLARMDEKLEWTRGLGDAFLAQESQVMDTVQQLRRRAQAAGNLQSGEQMHVQYEGPTISIQLASPQYAYVPYYDPLVVYGPWWWPAYRPVYWAPWPGYARSYHPGISVGFWWGQPIGLSSNFFFGNFDWHRHQVRVVTVNNYYYRAPVVVNPVAVAERGHWQHDPQRRRAVEYRQTEVRQRFANAQVERRDERRANQREEKRDDRSAERPAVPTQAQPRSPAQPRTEQRNDRRAELQAVMEVQRQTQARQQAQESQRPAQQQQARQQAQQAQEVQRKAQQAAQETQRKSSQEQRPSMPAAQAPQQPRAERGERREERREERQEQRPERGQKG